MTAERLQNCRFYILLLLILSTPLLYVEPGLFGASLPDAFNFPKRYLVESLALAIFILFSWELAACGTITVSRCRSFLPCAFFIGWCCISLVYSPSLHAGWRELLRWLCYGVIFFSTLSLSFTERRRQLIFSCAMAAASVASLVALMQYFGLDLSSFKGGLHTVYSTLGNPNYLASYLAATLPLGYWGWFSRAGRRAVWALSFSLIGTTALFATGARGGTAALLIGTLLSLTVSPRTTSKIRLSILVAVIAIVACLLLLPSPLNRYTPQTIAKFKEISGPSARSLEWRVMVWKISLEMAGKQPLIGNGIGSFPLLYLPSLAAFLSRPENRDYARLAEWGIDYAHNDYLQILVEAGAVGLFLFAWFILSILVRLVRAAKEGIPEGGAAGAVLAAFLALVFHAMASFPFHIWPSAVTLFILSGVIISAGTKRKELVVARRLSRSLIALGSSLFVLLSVFLMISSVVSEFRCAGGLRYFHAGDTPRALREFSRAVDWQPHNGRARFFLGLCLMEQGRLEEAAREMTAALRTYRRQQIYLRLGMLYDKLGERRDAARFIDMAVAMLPRDPDAWLVKGNLLFRRGNPAGAARCFQKSLSYLPDFFEAARNLAVSYDAAGRRDDALEAYRRALELRPDAADLYVNMGAIWAGRGDAKRARDLWEKALSIDPGNRKARKNLEKLGE